MPATPVTNCGVVEHDDDCLCDVVIDTPSPINYHPLNVKFASVCNEQAKWDGETIGSNMIDFMELLLNSADITTDLLEDDWGATLDVLNAELPESCLALVMDRHGFSYRQVAVAFACGDFTHPLLRWSAHDWYDFECFVNLPTSARLADLRYGLGQRACQRMYRAWGANDNDVRSPAAAAIRKVITLRPDASLEHLV